MTTAPALLITSNECQSMPRPATTNVKREAVISLYLSWHKLGKIASNLAVKRLTVYNIVNRYNTTCSVEYRPKGGGKRSKITQEIADSIKT